MAEVVDQSNYVGAIGIGFGDVGNGRDYMSQGFIPTLNNITSVSFKINSKAVGTNIGYRVWIDTADANSVPQGAVGTGIGGTTNIANATLVVGALTKYALSSTVTLVPGNQYCMVFAPWDTSINAWAAGYNDWVSSTANPYLKGKRNHADATYGTWVLPDAGNDDILFETYGTNSLVQSTGTANSGLGSTSVSWGANTTTGNLVVVGVALTNASVVGTVGTITDSQGNTYQKAVAGTISSVSDILNTELWYATNITGGAGSVNVSHTVDAAAVYAREYSGYSGGLDVTSAATGSSANPFSGTTSNTTVANELLIVATGDDKGTAQTWTAAGNFIDMVGTATTLTGVSMEDWAISSTGPQTGTLVLGAAANWDSLLASFKQTALAGAAIAGRKSLLGVGL